MARRPFHIRTNLLAGWHSTAGAFLSLLALGAQLILPLAHPAAKASELAGRIAAERGTSAERLSVDADVHSHDSSSCAACRVLRHSTQSLLTTTVSISQPNVSGFHLSRATRILLGGCSPGVSARAPPVLS